MVFVELRYAIPTPKIAFRHDHGSVCNNCIKNMPIIRRGKVKFKILRCLAVVDHVLLCIMGLLDPNK